MNISYLAEFRKAFKMTQEELANKAGLSVSTIQKWEKEGIPGKTLGTKVYYYSVALGCSIDVVIHFSELQKQLHKNKIGA